MRSLQATLRSTGFGKVAYHLWHRPISAWASMIAAGGPLEIRRTERGRRAMEDAVSSLPPAETNGAPLELHLLTGRRFWYQTAFCLWTFSRQSGRPVAPCLYDDGSLTSEYRESLRRLFPQTRFVLLPEILERLDQHLPAGKFPVLRERWQNYPNIRKLTDVHAGGTGWKLVIDSDLLFFRTPEFLAQWLERPERPLHAVDCATSYGYTRPLMNQLAAAPVSELVNVGLTGLRSEELDWEQLEYWTRKLHAAEGTSYYLEQGLIAMLLAGRSCAVAPRAEYVTLPKGAEASECRAVMHHYVADSKAAYFQHCWRVARER